MDYNTRIAIKIKELRMERGYKADIVARELEMSQSSYSQLENGKIEITLFKIEKIIKFYDIDLVQLLHNIGNTSPVFNIKKVESSSVNSSQTNHNYNNDLFEELKDSIDNMKNVMEKIEKREI